MSRISTQTITGKVFAIALAAGTMSVAMLGSTSIAEAKWGQKGAFFGGLGAGVALGVVGAALSNGGGYAAGPDYGYRRVCRMQPQYDEDGEYMGRARVCHTVAY